MKITTLLITFTVFLALLATSHTIAKSDNMQKNSLLYSGLQDPKRPAEDKLRDLNRKPSQVMDILGIKPGMTVLDILASGGYYTEVLSHQVGHTGKVYAHNNQFILDVFDGKFKYEMAKRLEDNRLANVQPHHTELDQLGLDNKIDVITLILNYHDLYTLPDDKRRAILTSIKSALKPSGTFAVIDMQGNGTALDKKLHRIDKNIVINEVKQAGFILVEDNSLLGNKDDDHSLSVFDPAIRGKTDRFILKFIKS